MKPPTVEKMFVSMGLCEDAACVLTAVLRALAAVPAEEIERGIRRLKQMEAFGPLLHPTFFVRNPGAFDNAGANRRLLEAALALRRLLPDPPGRADHPESEGIER